MIRAGGFVRVQQRSQAVVVRTDGDELAVALMVLPFEGWFP